jgi:hypothetical protein
MSRATTIWHIACQERFDMMVRTVVLVSCLSILPAVAAAQDARPASTSAPAAQSPAVRKDSKWNGALIGAGLGAIAGALIGSAMIECQECAGFNVPLTFGVIGAGAGVGIGIGIDALLQQKSPIPNSRLRVGRVNVAPVVGRNIKGVVASVRF